MRLRDEAVQHVQSLQANIAEGDAHMRSYLDGLRKDLRVEFPSSVRIDEEQKKELMTSFGNMMSARLGAFVKSGVADAEAMMELEKKVTPVTPENMGQAILGKILTKFMGD